MKLILSISLRNLLRQKRRSTLLGIAISFGMMILIMANSFSQGLSDTIFNRLVVNMTGHMEVSIMEKSRMKNRVIRDKDRIIKIINSNVHGINYIEESIGVFTSLIGNGTTDTSMLIGVINNKETFDYFKSDIIEGDLDKFLDEKNGIENPIILYDTKAKALNVKLKDVVKARLSTIYNQTQSARLTVVAILKANNIFESQAVFLRLNNIKTLLGYRPYETGGLLVNFTKINDPAYAVMEAEKLHKALSPAVAVIYGTAFNKEKAAEKITLLGYSNSEEAKKIFNKNIRMISGKIPDKDDETAALISENLAGNLNLKTGDSLLTGYQQKFEKIKVENTYKVAGTFRSDKIPAKNIILLNEDVFYKTYLENLPEPADKNKDAYIPGKKDELTPVYAPEWKLLPRTATSDDLKKKINAMTRTKWKGPTLDIRTMYEVASDVLDLEKALKLITFIAVLILFFIILIGVVNSLRMAIRERTREIGTIRAIGMQKRDVRNLFIIETLMLSAFSCGAGIILAFILMWIFGSITINSESVLSILLVEKHLYFMPDPVSIAGNFLLILLITAVTAYFPSRRAANLSSADALRHYE
ncbi:MAG: FtsX-like permease family protein [Spirochaetes bacterium]|nr:FtsX-like permease family protein [Spirochaetota bacterium]